MFGDMFIRISTDISVDTSNGFLILEYLKGRRLNKMLHKYAILFMLCANGWVSSSEEEMNQLNTETIMFCRICEAIKKYK